MHLTLNSKHKKLYFYCVNYQLRQEYIIKIQKENFSKMFKIYFRNNGEQKEIILPEASLLSEVIQEFNFPFDIEIVLCLFGNLGNELFLDPRLECKLENEDRERLNKIVAGKTYKDLHLCYTCYFSDSTLTIKNLIHELHHFQDIFECSTDYKRPVDGGGEYINTTGYIENLICTHLNDFYAEYYATKRMIDLRNDDRVKDINILSIVSMNLGYLKNNEHHAKEEIKERLEKGVSDFEKQLLVILFIQHYIIKLFLYFLANYRAFQEKGFSNQLYENHCSNFISNEIRPTLGNLLTKIQQKIMDGNLDLIEQSSELKDFLYDNILNFYKNDFNKYLSEMFEKRVKYPPFSFLQDLTRSINYNLIEQIRNINRSINLEWMKQIQVMNKSLMESITEPLSQLSKLTKNFNIIPKLGLNNHDDDVEQDENDEKGDSE